MESVTNNGSKVDYHDVPQFQAVPMPSKPNLAKQQYIHTSTYIPPS